MMPWGWIPTENLLWIPVMLILRWFQRSSTCSTVSYSASALADKGYSLWMLQQEGVWTGKFNPGGFSSKDLLNNHTTILCCTTRASSGHRYRLSTSRHLETGKTFWDVLMCTQVALDADIKTAMKSHGNPFHLPNKRCMLYVWKLRSHGRSTLSCALI